MPRWPLLEVERVVRRPRVGVVKGWVEMQQLLVLLVLGIVAWGIQEVVVR